VVILRQGKRPVFVGDFLLLAVERFLAPGLGQGIGVHVSEAIDIRLAGGSAKLAITGTILSGLAPQ
jgi:hypothetical protein